LKLGAYAVVVGTAITGIDYQVRAYYAIFKSNPKCGVEYVSPKSKSPDYEP
jgi:hypothetical protein